MKKVIYNVFYKPKIVIIDSTARILQISLGLFEENTDAQKAVKLIHKIESAIREDLPFKIHNEHNIEETLILESQPVHYYSNLKDFIQDNHYVKHFIQKEGINELNKLIKNDIIAEEKE